MLSVSPSPSDSRLESREKRAEIKSDETQAGVVAIVGGDLRQTAVEGMNEEDAAKLKETACMASLKMACVRLEHTEV